MRPGQFSSRSWGGRTHGTHREQSNLSLARALAQPPNKFATNALVSPYVAVGGGYAAYEQTFFQLDGGPNRAPRELHRAVFDFGGGADVKLWRWIGLRGEIRDFYSGTCIQHFWYRRRTT